MREVDFAFSFFIIIALLSMIGTLFEGTPSAQVIRAVPREVRETVIITGVDLNTGVGDDINVLTNQHLSSLASGRITTQEGSTEYRQYLRLTDGFTGGQLRFSKSEGGDVGDFLFFQNNQPLFEYEIQFDPALEGALEDGRSEDIEGEALLMLGDPVYISRVDASGNRISLRLVTRSGEVSFEDDDVSDTAFEQGVDVNGRSVDAQVRIRGSVSSNRVRITSLHYRPEGRSPRGDIYIPPKYGLRGRLQERELLLTPSFDIIYGGLSSGQRSGASSRVAQARVSGNRVHVRPSGGDEYKLAFTNQRGQSYVIPAYSLDGSIRLGENSHDLVVTEGSNSADFNIDTGDYFIVTSGSGTNAVTNVLRLQAVKGERIFVDDLAGGSLEEIFNGEGRLRVGGRSYRFIADTANERIVVDQNNDGSFDGDRADIVLPGGPRLELSSGSMRLRVPTKLFRGDRPSSDEVTTINLFEDDGDIDLDVPSQTSVSLESGRDGIEQGMTSYGVHFALNDRRTPADLVMTIPRGQVAARVAVAQPRGQARGWVVITTERERFMRG